MAMQIPEGKFMSTVKVGEKGQIVIPKGARELFDIKPGDTLLLLADKAQGIALVQNDGYLQFAKDIFAAQEKPEEDK
jgi:AbrB family looped-hinge helix DNA binding protein